MMLRKSVILLWLVSAAISLSAQEQRSRPNILFIMSDDHAAAAVSSYGSRINETPNIDRISTNGMCFYNAFCTNSICSPVRAVNLTGKMSHINGVLDNIFPFDGSQPTAPKYLQEAGYQTAMIGKWHLKSDPTGFDYWNILPDQGVYYNPDFIDNGTLVNKMGYTTTLITDIALDWLQRCDTTRPFFMMLHHKAPHRNWMPDIKYLNLYDDIEIPAPFSLFDDYLGRQAASEQEMSIEKDLDLSYDLKVWQDTSVRDQHPWMRDWMENRLQNMTPEQRQAFQDAYRAENEAFLAERPQGKDLVRWKYQRYIKDYLRCVASLDENVGRVLDYLEATGLDQNTLVIYTSDQGFYLGEHGWFDKRFMYEESYRMPLLMQWRGVIPQGFCSEALTMNLDFAPTFLDAAGLPVPEDMQGTSLLPILKTGQTPKDWRDATYYHYFEYPGTHAVKRHYGIRTNRHKLIHFYYDIDTWELYDLDEDPDELRNVYGKPAYQEVQAQLHARLLAQQQQYRDVPEQYQKDLVPELVAHAALGKPVRLVYPPEKQMEPNVLSDGRFRPYTIYNAGIREGYAAFRERPLEAVFDLGKRRTVRKIGVHAIESPESWIWFPSTIEIEVSDNGTDFRPAGAFPNDLAVSLVHGDQWFRIPEIRESCRYVKVRVRSRTVIPDGHPGAGKKAWVFVDEISIN